MRSSLFLIPILLLTGPASALDLQLPTDAAGVPVTTGAIMDPANAIVPPPVGENRFLGVPILSDAEIAALIPSSYSALNNPGTAPIMKMAKLAIGATA